MDKQASELLEKVRQQYEKTPYPLTPLERDPKADSRLYLHYIVNPYYLRNQEVITNQNKLILDAGCGTGYKALLLATANPCAKVIGVDISEASIKIARERLAYHGCTNVDFHVRSLEDLPELRLEFDYINCDEVLYLLPDPDAALRAMKSVLKPDGIIRANLHSYLQRIHIYQAQEFFKLIGVMDEPSPELQVELADSTLNALKDDVRLKALTFDPHSAKDKEWYLVNHLLQGDKGYTIPEMFHAIHAADLEFISMVNWRQWNLMELFKEPDNLPVFLGLALPETTVEEQLHLFELLHPIHRLLDFWCGHPDFGKPFVPVAEWQVSDWQGAIVHLHPHLKTPAVKGELINCLQQLQPFEISKHLQLAGQQFLLDSTIAACLLPLWESPQSMPSLVELWQKLRSVHPVTLEPTAESEAFDLVRQALMRLESLGYVLLEPQP